jgi:hypothetical protein
LKVVHQVSETGCVVETCVVATVVMLPCVVAAGSVVGTACA